VFLFICHGLDGYAIRMRGPSSFVLWMRPVYFANCSEIPVISYMIISSINIACRADFRQAMSAVEGREGFCILLFVAVAVRLLAYIVLDECRVFKKCYFELA
jgi:hypothetical protein